MSQLWIRTRTGLALGALLLGAATVAAVAVTGGPAAPAASTATASFINANAGTSLTAALGDSNAGSGPASPRAHHRHARRGRAHRAAFGLLRRIEHGQLVLQAGRSTRTVDIQRGRVSATSPTTVTLVSPDGFTATYQLTSASRVRAPHPAGTRPGIADVASGDWGEVIAVVNNGVPDVRMVRAHPYRGTPHGGATPGGHSPAGAATAS